MASRTVTTVAMAATDNFSPQLVARMPAPPAVSSEASDAAKERMARSSVAIQNLRENRL